MHGIVHARSLSQPLPAPSVIPSLGFSVTVPPSWLNYGVLHILKFARFAHAYPMIAVYDDVKAGILNLPRKMRCDFADAFLYCPRTRRGLTLVTSGSRVSFSEEEPAQVLIVASGPARDLLRRVRATRNLANIGEVPSVVTRPKDPRWAQRHWIGLTTLKISAAHYAPYHIQNLILAPVRWLR